jgi:hypothetical protein
VESGEGEVEDSERRARKKPEDGKLTILLISRELESRLFREE